MPNAVKERTGATRKVSEHVLCEDDFYGWVQEQVALLRAGRLDEIDLKNVAEELEDVGKSEYGALRSVIEVVLLHMLKWDFQPERRSRSWALSIAEHRERADIQLQESPSLKGRIEAAIPHAYRLAALRAARETRRSRTAFPSTCPYVWDEIAPRPIEWDEDR